jgi:N-acetylglucosaminyldiphosphoundecaprenol N-acetyl-beta-D-mannosaminyltransferase
MHSKEGKVDKISIAQIPVHLFTVQSLHETIRQTIRANQKKLFLHANAYLIELANTKEAWMVDLFNGPDTYVMCDGAGIQLAAKLTGQSPPEKIPYNLWIWDFVRYASVNNFKLFFLGADQSTLKKAIENLLEHEPMMQVAGSHHGYFNKSVTSAENQQIIKAISDSGADIIMVGFGMPLQEKWVKENFHHLDVKAIFTCGGAFDFISGQKKVAPLFFRKFYMEWLYRFYLEPVRLFQRVTKSNLKFMKIVLKSIFNK